ncbi:MAG: hypothetical protein HY935_07670 [Nitrosomonadales bacterium]|nr:hypothetical protein [Nitrosomonadales bacterium]
MAHELDINVLAGIGPISSFRPAQLFEAEQKAGDAFGEEALISDARCNATILMKSNGVLLRLGREDFLALLKEPLLHKIKYGDAVQAVEQGAVWLDVRYPTEYRFDSLRGAMNVPLNDIRNAMGVLDRSRKYIAYCQSGRRSAVAAFIMAQAGHDVHVLDGVGRCRDRCSSSLMRKTKERE